MISDELMAYLGPAAGDLSEEQLADIQAAAKEIGARYPHPDDQDKRDAALSVTVMHAAGDVTLDDACGDLRSARAEERRAYAAALQLAVLAVKSGMPKAVAARGAGIDRMSLLAALGER